VLKRYNSGKEEPPAEMSMFVMSVLSSFGSWG